MRYFVTGATGFIGGVVARQLREAGHTVIALVRNPARATDLAALGVTLARGDITDIESLRQPMKGVDGLFHIAGWYKIGVKGEARKEGELINVVGTRNVLEMMQTLGIPKGVYTSTIAINSDTRGAMPDETHKFNGTHISEYDLTKWRAHYEVTEPMVTAGLPLVTVMPGLVYGPGDTSIMRATWIDYLTGKLPLLPRDTAFCWGHIEDTARAHLLAMEYGTTGESYIVAGPPHTLTEAMDMAARITGIPAPKLRLPSSLLRATSALVRPFDSVLPLPPTYTAEGLRVSAATYLGDNRKAKRELRFDPRPLSEGLPDMLQHEMELSGMTGRRE